MRGQIKEKSKGVWLIRIESNKDGKRSSFSKQIRGTKKDAQIFLTAKLSEMDKGVFVQPFKQTLKNYLDQWLNTVAKVNVSEETFANYKWFIDNRISPRIGEFKLTDLRKADVQHFYNQMTAGGIGARMVRLCHSILHSALAEAVRLHLLSINSASESKLPKWTRKEISVLSPAQARAFQEVAQNNPNGLVLVFALESGMRPEEYLALK
ncbi:MAG TPA: N-terminal phage integrase SAM-like domain-containing protein [Pyrinomonadaceae bacterium]|jgi:integrase